MKTLDDIYEELWALRTQAEKLNIRAMDLLRYMERKSLEELKRPKP